MKFHGLAVRDGAAARLPHGVRDLLCGGLRRPGRGCVAPKPATSSQGEAHDRDDHENFQQREAGCNVGCYCAISLRLSIASSSEETMPATAAPIRMVMAGHQQRDHALQGQARALL